jgi:hypothetical protein
VSDVEWAELARSAGMRAIVIKSQFLPTVERAQLIRKMVSGIEIFGGIILNHSVGGLNLLSVEVAAELGAKVIWMPTWSSRNDISKGQFYLAGVKTCLKTFNQVIPGPEAGIEILEGGKLKGIVKEIVQIARDYQMVISSGHISVQESLVLVEECTKEGVPFMLAHPFFQSIEASIEEQKEVASRGGYIEHCFIQTMPMHGRLELPRIVEAMRAVGPSQTVMTTDGGWTWDPPAPEMMRMYIASLLRLKVDEESIRKMVQENPAKLLRLDEK